MHRRMLLNTLAAFFAFRGFAIEAGKHLYCRQTVRHRLRRIERQARADPRSPAELFVALEVLRTLSARPAATPDADRIR